MGTSFGGEEEITKLGLIMAKIENLQSLSSEELKDKLIESKKKLMEFQFKRKEGIDKPDQYRKLKKEIARILTVINLKRRKSE